MVIRVLRLLRWANFHPPTKLCTRLFSLGPPSTMGIYTLAPNPHIRPSATRNARPSQIPNLFAPKGTSAKDPAPSCPSGESLNPSLLLLVVHPLHPHPTAFEALPVPPDSLAQVLRPQGSPPVLGLLVLCLGDCLPIRIVSIASGRGRWEVGLFLVQLLDPLALHASRALDDVADEDLCYRAHANDDVLGNGLGYRRVHQLERKDHVSETARGLQAGAAPPSYPSD